MHCLYSLFIDILFDLNFQFDESIESVMNTATLGFDAKNSTTDDSFIHKVDWSDDEWSMGSSENSTKMDDTMDVYNYRIAEKYNIKKVSVAIEPSPISEVLDTSGLGWNTYFFDDSSNKGKLIKLEDTLEICSYRRASIESNATDTVSDSSGSTNDTVVINYMSKKNDQRVQFADSLQIEDFSNVSMFDTSHFIWDESSGLLNESSVRMEDSMDIFSYRHKSTELIHQRVAPLPARRSWSTAKLFDKMVIPNSLFRTPLKEHSGPITSSPVLQSSQRRSQM